MSIQLQAELRTGKSRSVIHGLRNKGRIPASVYGKKIAGGETISVDENHMLAILRKNPHGVIDLQIVGGNSYPVLINEIQRDKLVGKLLHVDFHQISMDEPVRSNISIELIGTPEGTKAGGILTVEMHEVEVRCLPNDLPSALSADISGLGIGDTLLVSALVIPEGVELLSDPHDVIATILASQKPDEEEAAEDTEAGAEAT